METFPHWYSHETLFLQPTTPQNLNKWKQNVKKLKQETFFCILGVTGSNMVTEQFAQGQFARGQFNQKFDFFLLLT